MSKGCITIIFVNGNNDFKDCDYYEKPTKKTLNQSLEETLIRLNLNTILSTIFSHSCHYLFTYRLFDWRPERMRGEPLKCERVVIIKNLFTPEDFDRDVQLLLEYQQDIRSECLKCGDVRKVVIYDVSFSLFYFLHLCHSPCIKRY